MLHSYVHVDHNVNNELHTWIAHNKLCSEKYIRHVPLFASGLGKVKTGNAEEWQ